MTRSWRVDAVSGQFPGLVAGFENTCSRIYDAAMSAKNPNNGATFTKGKPIRPPPSVPDPGREAAQLTEDRRVTAKSRRLHKLSHTDMHGYLRELGLLSGKLETPKLPIKLRRI
jgi:hypothetical protein